MDMLNPFILLGELRDDLSSIFKYPISVNLLNIEYSQLEKIFIERSDLVSCNDFYDKLLNDI